MNLFREVINILKGVFYHTPDNKLGYIFRNIHNYMFQHLYIQIYIILNENEFFMYKFNEVYKYILQLIHINTGLFSIVIYNISTSSSLPRFIGKEICGVNIRYWQLISLCQMDHSVIVSKVVKATVKYNCFRSFGLAQTQ